MANATPSAVPPSPTLEARDVFVAGVALVVASSTLVSEFTGVFTLGLGFAVALGLGFLVNLLLAVSAADLSVAMPGAGSLYDYARGVVRGRAGRALGGVLGLSFFGMSAFAFAGETASGALALQELAGLHLPVQAWILVLGAAAVLPNLFGLRATAWASAAILLVMLGLRWTFGIAGFLGLGQTGSWDVANLALAGEAIGQVHWFGEAGVLSLGLALAVWSFVGIEFACSLSGDVRRPGRAMPVGLLSGLVSAMPRLLARLAQDGVLLGPVGRRLGRTHRKTGVPVHATVLCVAVYLLPSMASSAVVEWVYSAAYVWLGLYGCFHVLVLIRQRSTRPGLQRLVVATCAAIGVAVTVSTIALGFEGSHLAYGGRAMLVVAASAVLVVPSVLGARAGAVEPDEAATPLPA